MVTRKYFWRQIFGICEKYEVNYTANWSQNNTKMTVLAIDRATYVKVIESL